MKQQYALAIALCLMVAGAVFAQEKPEHKYFTTKDGVKIHFMVMGKGTPVILIHGYTGSAEGNWFRNGIAGRDPQEDEASRALRIRNAMDNGKSREEAEKLVSVPRQPTAAATQATTAAATRPQPAGPQLDLTKIAFPVMAINGEFDRPLAKTVRMHRELRDFTNVVLPGKSHLTAIAAPYMPKEYLESVVRFINANDPKK
jgi:pimeloyl-ACP methyl ester carboxylesterase